MSSNLFSTVTNYSGRQPDNQQGIKQFVTTIKNQAIWTYKRVSSGEVFITPADSKKNVFIKKNQDIHTDKLDDNSKKMIDAETIFDLIINQNNNKYYILKL